MWIDSLSFRKKWLVKNIQLQPKFATHARSFKARRGWQFLFAAPEIYRILHKCMLDLGMPPHAVIDWAEFPLGFKFVVIYYPSKFLEISPGFVFNARFVCHSTFPPTPPLRFPFSSPFDMRVVNAGGQNMTGVSK